MNIVLVEARVNEKLKEPTGKEFAKALDDNFKKKPDIDIIAPFL